MFIVILFMKAMKLDIIQILIIRGRVSDIFIYVEYYIAVEMDLPSYMQKLGWIIEIQCWVKTTIPGKINTYFINLKQKYEYLVHTKQWELPSKSNGMTTASRKYFFLGVRPEIQDRCRTQGVGWSVVTLLVSGWHGGFMDVQ